MLQLSLLTAAFFVTADMNTEVADLKSTDARIRAGAAERLARMGESAREAAVPLVEATGDGAEEVRNWATAALEQLGPPEASATTDLARLLSSSNADRAYWAATLLGRLGRDASPAVQPLAEALSEHPVLEVRQRAAWALGKIGAPAAPAIEALEKASITTDARLARLAVRAIEQIRKDMGD